MHLLWPDHLFWQGSGPGLYVAIFHNNMPRRDVVDLYNLKREPRGEFL